MELSEYPRPAYDTGIGFTGPQVNYPFGRPEHWGRWLAELRAMNASWYKAMLDENAGEQPLAAVKFLLDNGIMPVVRVYRREPNPGTLSAAGFRTIEKCVKMGVRYFETNNEPNLHVEWHGGRCVIPMPDAAYQCAEDWLVDARVVLDLGGLPAIPAMAPGGNFDDMWFLASFLDVVKDRPAILSKAWVAIHNYALNHPLDYPDDDVNRNGTPLAQADYKPEWYNHLPLAHVNAERDTGKHPGGSIMDPGESNGFRKYEGVANLCLEELGRVPPVISTEGGPVMDVGFSNDPRYRTVLTQDVHAGVAAEMARRMVGGELPDYYFALCYWVLANKLHENPVEAGFEGHAWYPHWKPDGIDAVRVLKALPKEARPAQQVGGQDALDEAARTAGLAEWATFPWLRKAAIATGWSKEGASGEFPFTHGGKAYIGQVYLSDGLVRMVYCPVGEYTLKTTEGIILPVKTV